MAGRGQEGMDGELGRDQQKGELGAGSLPSLSVQLPPAGQRGSNLSIPPIRSTMGGLVSLRRENSGELVWEA